MISRVCIKCGTCDKNYTFHIAIGHASIQEHTVICESCGEEITIRLRLNQSNGTFDGYEFINCSQSDNEGKIINLHPEYALPKEFMHVDFISPNLLAMRDMIKDKDKLHTIYKIPDIEKEKLAKATLCINEEWSTVSKIWSLNNRNKNFHLTNFIEQNRENIFEYKKNITANEIIFSFLFRCLAPSLENKLQDAISLIGAKYRSAPETFRDFCNYHAQYIFSNNMEKIYSIVRDFFVNYSEYSQNFLEIKKGSEIKLPYSYSSVNFEKTKKFYGDAYECLGSCVTTLACLSNIIKDRKFDTFNEMDLNKYLTLDKSGKGKCFSDIPEFSWLMLHYVPQLRNGSHHGTFKFDSEKKIISYIPTKKQHVHHIEYFDYLNKCTYMLFSCCIVGAIDIFLYDKIRYAVMRDSCGIICDI